MLPLILLFFSTVFSLASLAIFGAMLFFGPLRLVDFGWSAGGALLFDAALSCLFFLQHSVMVRPWWSRFLERYLEKRLHPAAYAAASGAVLLFVGGLWQSTHVFFRAGPVFSIFAHGVFVLACLWEAWGMLALGGFDPLGVKNALGRSGPPTQEDFRIRGPYCYVRHPLYTGVILMLWACPVWSLDRVLLAVLWTVWIVVATRWEERDLVDIFGDNYREYQRRTPMLIPRLFFQRKY